MTDTEASDSWKSNVILNEDERHAFRVMQMTHFESMLQHDTLYFPSTTRWEDPHENLLRTGIRLLPGGRGAVALGQLTAGYAALCFSKAPESDAMWRLYGAPDVVEAGDPKLTIRIEFDLEAVAAAVWNKIGQDVARLSVWGKSVKYRGEDDHRREMHALIEATDGQIGKGLLDPTGKQIAETLFLKRRAFDYEREVRLIIDGRTANQFAHPDANGGLESVRIPVPSARSLVRSVQASPWVNKDHVDLVKERARRAGWDGDVLRSSLYDDPIAIASQGPWSQ